MYKEYRLRSGDQTPTVIASTASPYKFAPSVMMAIDPANKGRDEFELIDELEKLSGREIPKAIEEIRNAEIRHKTTCKAADMETTVKSILGIR